VWGIGITFFVGVPAASSGTLIFRTYLSASSYYLEEGSMSQTTTSQLQQIHSLLASRRYSVAELSDNVLRIQDVESGIALRAVLEGNILFFSLVCMIVPATRVTSPVLRKMLAADNGISTSHFQLYDAGAGSLAVTLNNFCKLQELGPDDEDDILSCVNFLLADVVHAKHLLGADLAAI
jgi:hypothetical protein